ncbi:carotenoid oxygenase family protein [Sorangium sp. So ce315]|uniref:carotenoid oxygenase family protein n=1 Tax=Sorangium sp. So ce315 TaxID=3133299 RepID=UPI003F5D9655
MTASGVDLPIHLVGNNAPVSEEVTVAPREVRGKMPAELFGRYVRNGPTPRTGWSPHASVGDGKIHSVALDGGQARSCRNRWKQTGSHEATDPRCGRHAYSKPTHVAVGKPTHVAVGKPTHVAVGKPTHVAVGSRQTDPRCGSCGSYVAVVAVVEGERWRQRDEP